MKQGFIETRWSGVWYTHGAFWEGHHAGTGEIMTILIWAGVGLRQAEAAPESDLAVCVQGNQIAEVGTRQVLRARYPDAEQVGGDHLLLMPALVNSHDHGRGIGSVSLGVADDLLEIWLRGLGVQPVISPYLAAAYDGIQMLRAGVGTTAHSHNPRDWHHVPTESEDTLRGYRDAGIRVACHPVIINQNTLVYDDEAAFLAGLPPAVRQLAEPMARAALPSPDDYFAMCADLYARHHDSVQHTAHIQVSPAGGQWCSDDLILAAVEFARQRGTRVQMHLLETRYQARYAYRKWGVSFVRHLDDIGALGPWLTLAHMVWADTADVPLLADRGVGIAHNPSSNLRLRSGIAPLARFDMAGISTGIGLDGHALDDDQDYLREMRLAWTLSNRPGADAPTVTAQRILRMGTGGGAAVTLGADAPLGRLAPGCLADLVLLDWRAVCGRWSPADYPPLSGVVDLLLRRAARQHVRHVMVNGQWVVQDGRALLVDEDAIADAIREELAWQNLTGQAEAHYALRMLAPHLRRFYAAWDM
jgi:5-methylthioadenosine/S-adenosylhomocysteine deaminase